MIARRSRLHKRCIIVYIALATLIMMSLLDVHSLSSSSTRLGSTTAATIVNNDGVSSGRADGASSAMLVGRVRVMKHYGARRALRQAVALGGGGGLFGREIAAPGLIGIPAGTVNSATVRRHHTALLQLWANRDG